MVVKAHSNKPKVDCLKLYVGTSKLEQQALGFQGLRLEVSGSLSPTLNLALRALTTVSTERAFLCVPTIPTWVEH